MHLLGLRLRNATRNTYRPLEPSLTRGLSPPSEPGIGRKDRTGAVHAGGLLEDDPDRLTAAPITPRRISRASAPEAAPTTVAIASAPPSASTRITSHDIAFPLLVSSFTTRAPAPLIAIAGSSPFVGTDTSDTGAHTVADVLLFCIAKRASALADELVL